MRINIKLSTEPKVFFLQKEPHTSLEMESIDPQHQPGIELGPVVFFNMEVRSLPSGNKRPLKVC